MLMTRMKPVTVGEILVEEFMQPLGLTQAALAEAISVRRNLRRSEAIIRRVHSGCFGGA